MRAIAARWAADAERRPLAWLTLIALVPRVLAAFFSGGYVAQDDHFLVIEAAQSWADGFDYNNWLPWNQPGTAIPTGHMMVYPGLHFLLFKLLNAIGLNDPSGRMIVVRLLHALWSSVIVRTGYRIAERLGGTRIAWRCGLFLALFWFMPFLSVHNLVEVVAAPLLLLSAWWLVRDEGSRWKYAVFAGLFAGLAINIRFQTVFFPAGVGLALLLRREWSRAVVFGLGTLLPVVVLQGGIDLFIWGRPFAEMTQYVAYNMANSTTYFDQPWYNYLLVLAGVLLPPLSLGVLFGFLRTPKPWPVWLGVISFVFFHSIFPNKQERFILPVVPLLFTLGYCGWERWREGSTWWRSHQGLWRGTLIWTWTLNLAVLVPLTFSYSKRERVEAMLLLRRTGNVHGMIMEDTAERDAPMPPLFYLGQWGVVNDAYTDTTQDLRALVDLNLGSARANTILFVGDERLAQRVHHAEVALGPLALIGRAEPGLLDRTIHWLNPVNRNAVITLYRIQER